MENKEQPKMKSPLDIFFKLGNKLTPQAQQDFMYCMLWILFLSFVSMFGLNLYKFITTIDFSFLVWAGIGFAISSLQFFNLKNMHLMRKARKEMPKQKPEEEHKVEDVDEMLKGFGKGGKDDKPRNKKPKEKIE